MTNNNDVLKADECLQLILDALGIDDLNINSRGLFEGYIRKVANQPKAVDVEALKESAINSLNLGTDLISYEVDNVMGLIIDYLAELGYLTQPNTPPKPLNDAQTGDLNEQAIPADAQGSGVLTIKGTGDDRTRTLTRREKDDQGHDVVVVAAWYFDKMNEVIEWASEQPEGWEMSDIITLVGAVGRAHGFMPDDVQIKRAYDLVMSKAAPEPKEE